MAITQGVTNQWKQDVLRGVHQEGDSYRIALYTNVASLDKSVKAYTKKGEVVGAGYEAGGILLSGTTYGSAGDVAYMDWSDPIWAKATITARGALIYNASKGNVALSVIDFGQDYVSTNGRFEINLPLPGAAASVFIS